MRSLDSDRRELMEVVRSADPLIRGWFRRARPTTKADGSPVTEADLAVQAHLVAALGEAFPDDGVRSEEGVARAGRSGSVWQLDPIDGTAAFVQGLAYWGPTLCRRGPDGRIDVGVFHVPLLGETWSVARRLGAWRGEDRLPPVPDAPVDRSDFLFVPSRIHLHPGLPWPGKIRALGSTAAHLALVAAGAGRAAIVPRWSLWDVGCGALMAEEVGLGVFDLEGRPVDLAVCPEGLPLVVGAPTAVRILITGGWSPSVGGRPNRGLGWGTT